MESHRLLEDLLNQSRRQTRLLEEIRDLLEERRAGDGGGAAARARQPDPVADRPRQKP